MTSEERHEARYRRRKAERQRRRDARSEACGSFEQVFSYEHLCRAGRECCKGVGWKCSTQRYLGNFTANIARTHRELMDGTWKTKGFFAFDLMERGKLRHIRSVHIAERVVQRCLCDNALVPLFSAAFVYDNAASLKGKGIDFAMDRLTCHLQRYYRKHGTDGWALVFDFSDYFNSAPHAPIYAESERRIRDERVQKLACGLMEDFGERGFGLGSQVSQIDALMLPNRLDHFIKEQLHIEGYGRYMDDFFLIHEDKAYLQYCRAEIEKHVAAIGLSLNNKTNIYPLRNGIDFLGFHTYLTETGAVIRKVRRRSKNNMKRKLKKMRGLVERGKITTATVEQSYKSWRGHAEKGNCYHLIRRTDHYYNRLFNSKEAEKCQKH